MLSWVSPIRIGRLVMSWRSIGPVWEAPHWQLPISCDKTLHPQAISCIWVADVGACSLRLHGLEKICGASHVLEMYERFEDFHNFTHQWSSFGVSAETMVSKLGSFLCSFDREVTFKTWVYKTKESSSITELWTSPFHKVVLPIWSIFVHGPSASDHFKEDHPKTVHITLWGQVS